jgi:GT2 family glycosyltransferase
MQPVCDVIIPVHDQPHWVSLCIEELLRTTDMDTLGRIFLVNDGSDALTCAGIKRMSELHPPIRVLENSREPGFAGTINTGLESSSADYVLLLNTDCLLTPRAIAKLIAHCEREPAVGLISPFSNQSPPLTVPMLPGFNYRDMNSALEEHFGGVSAEACTIVGNALLITRPCLDRTGLFDTRYGLGYGEETDYQFRAMANGFKAVAALDTYVYHKGAESFGANPKTQKRLQSSGRRLFFRRWKKEFELYSERVPPDALVKRVIQRLRDIDHRPAAAAMFVLPGIKQHIGGCHVVIDICNMAARLGQSVQVAVLHDRSQVLWCDPLFFEPICFGSDVDFVLDRHVSPQLIVATAWTTVAPAALRAEAIGVHWHYFVQGYEFYFEEGCVYRAVEETFQNATHVFTTSGWLKRMLAAHFTGPIEVIPPGFDERLFHDRYRRERQIPVVTLVLRGSLDKGQPFLMDLLHRLGEWQGRIKLVVIVRREMILPSIWADACDIHFLPLRKLELANILRDTDIFVDASLHEGFGLLPLEALACGAAVITSASGGVADYVRNGENGFLITEVNNPERYVEKLEQLLGNPSLLKSLQENASPSVASFASTSTLQRHCNYLAKASIGQRPRKRLISINMIRMMMGRTANHAGSPSPAQPDSALLEYAPGSQIPSRVRKLEQDVAAIQNSRIWRTLCAGGGLILAAQSVMRRARKPFSRTPRR